MCVAAGAVSIADVAVASTVAIARASGAEAGPLTDDRGASLAFAHPPRRIVSLVPSVTESLCAIGACDLVVGTDRYSDWPPEVRARPKLGGLDDTPVEAIVALAPDLVFVSPSARLTGRLESLGIRTAVVETRDHADVKRSLDRLGRLLGREAQAAATWNTIGSTTRGAASRVPVALRGARVYFEIDSTPYAAGNGSFIDETLRELGLRNVLPAELGAFPKLNPELVVRLSPDVVMAVRGDLDAMPSRPGWSSLAALRAKRTCGFSSEAFALIAKPGPRLGEAASMIADCLVSIDRSRR